MKDGKITKSDLVANVSASKGFSKKDTAEIIQGVFDEIVAAVKAGNDVAIKEFGIFKAVTTKERTARDMSSGKEIKVAPYKTMKFKISGALKAALKEFK